MKLLVVEDERMLCDTIAKSLHHAGYEVDCCYDGAEALERLLIEQYDLIVLDLHLPGMDGMEVLERLRQTDAETKVLILSARSQVADKVAGLDAGANDYLGKALSFAGAGGKGAQPDTQAVHSAKHSLGLRRHFL